MIVLINYLCKSKSAERWLFLHDGEDSYLRLLGLLNRSRYGHDEKVRQFSPMKTAKERKAPARKRKRGPCMWIRVRAFVVA